MTISYTALLADAVATIDTPTASMVDVRGAASVLEANGVISGDSAGLAPELYDADNELRSRWLLGQIVEVASVEAEYAVNTWINLTRDHLAKQ